MLARGLTNLVFIDVTNQTMNNCVCW